MSEQKQSATLAETPATPVELSSEELGGVAGGLAAPTVPGGKSAMRQGSPDGRSPAPAGAT